MKKIILFLTCLSVVISVKSQEAITVKPGPVNMQVHNVCYNAGALIVCNGNDSLGIHPSFGFFDNSAYQHFDSLLLFTRINHFGYDYLESMWGRLAVLGDSNNLIAFRIYPGGYFSFDTLMTDSINDVYVENGRIFVATGNSVLIFDSAFANPVYTFPLNFSPKVVAGDYYNFAVAGRDITGNTRLQIYLNMTLSLDTLLGNVVNDPFDMKTGYQGFNLISSPGDTAIYSFDFNVLSHQGSFNHIYSGSGPHCFSFNSSFNFQPESDTSMQGLENNLNGWVNINRRVKAISDAMRDSYCPYLAIVPDSPNIDRFIYLDASNYSPVDSFQTGLNPKFIANYYHCPVKITEYDDSKVEWQVYPNPSATNTTLVAAGLICGRDYKLDIVNISGKVLYETIIHSKTSYQLPIDKYPAGVYFIRIQTLKGLITQKLVKM